MKQEISYPNVATEVPTEDLLDIRGLLEAFKRRLGAFFAIALIVFSLVVVYTLQQTPMYTATSSIMLDVREREVTDIESVLAGLPADAASVETEVRIIQSRALARRVVDELDLTADPEFNSALREPSGFKHSIRQVLDFIGLFKPDQVLPTNVPSQEELAERTHQRVVGSLISGLEVSRVGTTYVINIAYTSEDRAKAALIANTFAEQYQFDQLEAKFDATARANEWLNERLSVLREEVLAAENAIEIYRADTGLLSAEGSSLTEQQISDVNSQLILQRAEYNEALARLDTVRTQVSRGASADTMADVLNSQLIRQLRGQQAEVARRRAELSSTYGPRHPQILTVEREAEDIQVQIDLEVARIVASLESEVEVARTRVRSLEGSLSELRTELGQNNRSLVRLRELERDADASRTLYESFLNRFRETGAEETFSEADVRIVSEATTPGSPSSPNLTLNLAFAIALAGIAGVAAIVVLEFFDSGIRTGDQVERELRAPFVSTVPLLFPGVLGSIKRMTGGKSRPEDWITEKPLSSFTESFRAIRSAVLISNLDQRAKVVAVTSALPGEGKTTTSLALARLSAMAGAKTIVVDCDLRRKALSRTVAPDEKERPGLLDVLSGQKNVSEAVVKDTATNADVLVNFAGDYTPTDVFGSERFEGLLNELKQRYDFIILDTAPVLPVTETRTIAHMADTNVLVVKWRKTPRSAAQAAMGILSDVDAKVTGVILSQVNPRSRNRVGYVDYGFYYSKYRNYYTE
ncbi:polysaccharide biosynthesis tyrosine autokinase [Ponticaulis sp.]|uniref:GumC family protein n=1 Tax=Ponticaulis sp. TaxID=2020902 RepID=UPI000B69E116|nr:polysaccharide biosynthesis tyrosine autokinase [Ponticaulis sp.]MAI91874.1 capsular biosynthesis protein [Ponticaulis sp.]OUX96556.1 MAG: hypothetical protein CBB65_15700 [Hyphomonadaceae bacterium TMED5]|tara:strand:+ start:29318 stop:31579 length:2262 start_codon:yes stop_codon:yes gene_type:complete